MKSKKQGYCTQYVFKIRTVLTKSKKQAYMPTQYVVQIRTVPTKPKKNAYALTVYVQIS